MEWINPRTIVGPPAENEKYLERPEINKLFWHAITNKEHVLFTAPRRVGKSSVMKDLEKTAPEGILAIYQNVESDKSSQDFYLRLWSLIVSQLNGSQRWKMKISDWLRQRQIGEISIDGAIKIESTDLNYKRELLDLIEELGKTNDTTIVLMLDEFPDAVNNVRKNEGDAAAIDLLHVMRAIRHEEKFKCFRLVIAGSIGLEHVITSIDRIKLINDLRRIPVGALDKIEVKKLLTLMLQGATMQMGESEQEYLMQKVQHWLPYFFQLMVVKCNEMAYRANQTAVSNEVIDAAFEAILSENEHFSDWETRLRDYLSKSDNQYCLGLLTRCAHSDFTLQQAYNYSKTARPDTGYKALIDDVLIKDGYLVEDGGKLKFLSPFLNAWWAKRHPKFEIED